ncbi:MAG: division/cell wall cluster transcriptional repressor MraZ [Patescibacteria group bacterium]
MLIGRFYHKLESKGRVSLPKAFREIEKNWVLTRGLDGGLFLFKAKDFEKEINKLSERTFTRKDNRDFVRLMSNDACQVSADKNGRVLLPEYLTKFAKFKKNLVIVGSYSRIEIWDQDLYHEYIDKLEEKSEDISETLYDPGLRRDDK